MTQPWRKRTVSNKGFTLLEVLVALALLGILCASLYGTYFSLMRGREARRVKVALYFPLLQRFLPWEPADGPES